MSKAQRRATAILLAGALAAVVLTPPAERPAPVDPAAYASLLSTAEQMWSGDGRYPHVALLYDDGWQGLSEGAFWRGWWIQNSLGPTYAAAPFMPPDVRAMIQRSQDLWWQGMGDGQRREVNSGQVVPDGVLCDAATPGRVVHQQGDRKPGESRDWPVSFTAAGVLMQTELLLVTRDLEAAQRYLPLMRRSAAWLTSRRDETGLLLAGTGGNLLAPSFAPPEPVYLSEASILYIAALERLAEVERLCGNTKHAARWACLAGETRAALPRLWRDGYYLRALGRDGTEYGRPGAARHGYLETGPTCDAVAFGVADDAQAQAFYRLIAARDDLRPHAWLLPNAPAYDDAAPIVANYRPGDWVDGGCWPGHEARTLMLYARVGAFEDMAASMERLLAFARRHDLVAPFSGYGQHGWSRTLGLTYDVFGIPAGLLRATWQPRYTANTLTLTPCLPPGLAYVHRLPLQWGSKRIYLAITTGTPRVTLNGRELDACGGSVTLAYDDLPPVSRLLVER